MAAKKKVEAAPVEATEVVNVVREFAEANKINAKIVRASLRKLGFSAPYDASAIAALELANEKKEAE